MDSDFGYTFGYTDRLYKTKHIEKSKSASEFYLYKYREITEDDLSNCYNIKALCEGYAMLNNCIKFQEKDENDSKIYLVPPSDNALRSLLSECPSQHKPKLRSWIGSDNKKIIQAVDKVFNDMVARYGIYCFSSSGVSCHMWEKYADEHKGFCIEFIRQRFLGKKVQYKKAAPRMNMIPFIKELLEIPNDGLGEKIYKLLHIKLNKWEHEEEYRFINTGMLPQGEKNMKKKYSQDSVSSVIFGEDMKLEHKEFITKNIPLFTFKQAKRVALLRYDPCLMSGVTEPKQGDVYLKEINKKIAYAVISPDGKFVKDIDTEIKAPSPFDLERLALVKDDVLEKIAKKGHIRSKMIVEDFCLK